MPIDEQPFEGAINSSKFRQFLQAELVRRCKINPRYSLRAFARLLTIEPSALSKILSGKRSVTPETFQRFSTQLALGPEKRHLYVVGAKRKGATSYDLDEARLTLDAFQTIADWYHMAILELTGVSGFRSDARWIARALGISIAEASDAVERLIRMRLLRVTPRGRMTAGSGESTTIGSADTAAALRSMQRQVLALATHALDETPAAERDQSTMTMAVNLKRLPEAKERIKDFRRELCAFLEEKVPHEEVFQLSISLFPVSRVRQLNNASPSASAVSRQSGTEDLT